MMSEQSGPIDTFGTQAYPVRKSMNGNISDNQETAPTGSASVDSYKRNALLAFFAGFALVFAILLIATGISMAATVTLTPDIVSAPGSWGVSAANLNDGSDGTFASVTGAASTFTVGFGNDPAYAGATINSVTLWVRGNATGSGGAEKLDFGASPTLSGAPINLPRTPAISNFFVVPVGPFTPAGIDALQADVATTTLGGTETARVFEVWAVIDYTPSAGNTTINACDGCHGEPPIEAASRNLTGAGEVVGSHAAHSAYTCDTCHGNNAILGHREGDIDMLANIQGGSYSKGTTFAQGNDLNGTGLGSCSDVNCHGGASSTTPTWGNNGAITCDFCHGAPPATNAHATHYTAKGWTSPDVSGATCTACHPDNSAGHSDVTDNTVIVNAGLTPSGASPAISCSTPVIGCHNGTVSPTWTTTAIACTVCHTVGGSNSATVANPVSGLHNISAAGVQKHDNTLTVNRCEECHAKASISGHWDGTAGGATPDYTAAQVGVSAVLYTDAGGTGTLRGTCSTACHSDGSNWQRQWSTAANSTATVVGDPRCDVCHGQFGSWRSGTSHEGTFGAAASTRGNSHNSLGGTANSCEDCHVYPTDSAKHKNGSININDAGGVIEIGGRAYCGGCHSDDGAPTTSGTHTYAQSDFPLAQIPGANDPVGSCTGCHGGATAGPSASNYWPDQAGNLVASEKEGGRHLLHMEKLSGKVYGETITALLTDNGNGTSDAKQRTLCEYCHAATTNDSDHRVTLPADVFVDADAVRHAKSLWGAADGNAAYTKASDSCSNVDCHNSKAAAGGTFGWYGSSTTTCTLCHTVGGAGSNPTSGLHNINPRVSGQRHDDTLTACAACHNAMPTIDNTGAATHINGSFTADGAANGDRGLTGLYTDGTPGSCSGAIAGAAGCHDGSGDAGTWKRLWSTTAANSNGTECANCHGGFGASDWTFGSNNASGDGSMSHTKDWDVNAASELIGKHSGNTGLSDKCNTCHVYPSAPYSSTWGTGSHGNDKIEMNSALGYLRSGGSAYGCTTNCHTTGGSHLTEGSGWTLAGIAGPGLSCTGCHNGSGGGALNVSSASPHVITTRGGSFNACEDCHPGGGVGSRHSATGVIGIPNKANVGINYVDGVNGYSGYAGVVLGGDVATGATEAEMCWGCHDQNSNGTLNDANDINEWGTNTGSTYNYGTLSNRNWFSAAWTSGGGFTYKNGPLTTGMGTKGASTHGTNGGAAGVDTAAKIGCSYCHDVHDTTGTNGKPYLRGSWIGSRYPEDGAPLSSHTFPAGANKYSAAPEAPPRTHAGANEAGGWQIDANNGNPNTGVTFAQHAGLCTLCHGDGDAVEGETADRDVIQSLWSGHTNTIAGGSHNGTNNIFSNSIRNGTGNYATGMWMGAMNSVGYSGSWMHGLRNTDDGTGIAPPVNGRALAYQGFAWAGMTVDAGSVNASFHNFTCSKCHNPHASRLPKLMITNCLDVRHNTWDSQFTGDAKWSNWTGYTRNNNKELAYASTAQNCHRYADMPAGGAVEEPGWNSVTPW
jgi:predicted CxxxxCH...CXXCH cytochrome family protein